MSDCINLLEDIGYENIRTIPSRNELRFARERGSNPTSMKFSTDTLKYVCFSTGERGDVFSLVMDVLGYTFPEALKYIADFLNLSEEVKSSKTKIIQPFGGFYRKIAKEENTPEFSMETYNDSVLKEYRGYKNLLFFRDGIDFDTQESFDVGYDFATNRITIPEYTLNGELCGIMGRLNESHCDKGERWLPIIPCSRSLTLYGYHKNYASIQQKNVVVIGESEKFVMQLHSIGIDVGLSICGCNISKTQQKYIKGLMAKQVILALDEGLEEEQIREEAIKLKSCSKMLDIKIGYIYDKNNNVLKKGAKQSPSDLGRDAFEELYKNHIVWLN